MKKKKKLAKKLATKKKAKKKNWQKKKKKLAKNWLVPDRKCIWHLRVKLSKIAGKYQLKIIGVRTYY